MHTVLGIAVTTAILIGLGIGAVIGFIAGWFSGKGDTAEVTMDWGTLPAPGTAIDEFTHFSVRVTATLKGKTYNVPNQEVTFTATTPDVTIKQPPNGKVNTGPDGIATCAFSGSDDGSTKIHAKMVIDGKTIAFDTPTAYETVQ